MLRPLLSLFLFAAVGRVLLSFLPAGWPGRHDRRELGVTLVVSFLLGWLVLLTQAVVVDRLGGEAAAWWHYLPWLALAVLRVATLPAGLRPRHEPPLARPDRVARALFVAGWIAWIALIGRKALATDLELAMSLTSTPLVCGALSVAGLERARRAPWARGLVWLLVALLASLVDDFDLSNIGWTGAFMALGGSGMIAWLRRADRRGLALAVIGFAAVGMNPTSSPFGAAGLLALVLCTPAASRRRALGWSLAAGGSAGILSYTCLRDFGSLPPARVEFSPASFVWVVPVMALPLTVVWVRLAQRVPSAGAVAAPGRELLACALALTLSVAAAAVADAAGGWPSGDTLWALTPASLVFLLLAFAPPERVEPAP